MSTHLSTAVHAAVLAALFAAAPAQSQMYRWMDSEGSITFSNQLPSDRGAVRDLTVVLDDSDRQAGDLPHVETQPATPSSTPALIEPSQISPRIAISPNAPEAVRDPCLLSSDPKCIERNKAAYVPYRGYSPSSAVGATPGTSAGGTLSGGTSSQVKMVAPKSSLYALPPGSDSPAPKTTSRR